MNVRDIVGRGSLTPPRPAFRFPGLSGVHAPHPDSSAAPVVPKRHRCLPGTSFPLSHVQQYDSPTLYFVLLVYMVFACLTYKYCVGKCVSRISSLLSYRTAFGGIWLFCILVCIFVKASTIF